MSESHTRKIVSYGLSALVFVIAIVAWQVLVDYLHIPVYLLPGPTRILKVLLDPSIQWSAAIAITLIETVEGFTLSVVVGLLLAIVLAQFRTVRNIIYPYIL